MFNLLCMCLLTLSQFIFVLFTDKLGGKLIIMWVVDMVLEMDSNCL